MLFSSSKPLKSLLGIGLLLLFSATLFGQTKAQVDLPISWDDSAIVNYDFQGFGGNSAQLAVDPVDASNTVLSMTRTPSGQIWQGTLFSNSGLASPIPFSSSSTFITLYLYSPSVGIPIRLKAEDATNPAIAVETEINTSVANAWDTLTFDFANHVLGTQALDTTQVYAKLTLFCGFGSTPAANETYYVDDVFFGLPNSTPPTGTNNSSGVDTILQVNENSLNDTLIDLQTIGIPGYFYTITSGDTNGNFAIDSNLLTLSTTANLDYEVDSVYQLTCFGTNGFSFDTLEIEVQINNVIEPVYAGFGKAFDFDGVNDYAEFSRKGLPANKEPKTIGVWVKRDGNSTNSVETILSFGEGFANITLVPSSGSIRYYFTSNSITSGNSDLPSNRWTFITMVFDTTYIRTYINGQLDKVSSLSNSIFQFASNTPYKLNIGRDPSGNRDNFTGGIDEVTIWNRTLNQNEIKDLYENGPQLFNEGLVTYLSFNEINSNLEISNLISNEIDTLKNASSADIINGPSPGTYNSGIFNINKTYTTNDTIGQLFSYDIDRSAKTYSLISGGLNAFSISPSGVVQIASQSIFDTLSSSSYELSYLVSELGDNQIDTGVFSINFTSFLGPKSMPFYQGFEGDSNYVNLGGDNGNWRRWTGASPNFYGGTSGAYEGQYFFYLPEHFADDSALFELPYIDFSSANSPFLSFKYHSYTDYRDPPRLRIEIEKDNSGNWITIFDTAAVFQDIWNSAHVDLSAFSSANLIKLRFTASNRRNGNELAVDNIVVSEPFAVDVAAFGLEDVNCFSEDSLNISGEIRNLGTTTINTVDYNFYNNGALVQSNTLTSLNLTPQSSHFVTLGTFSKSQDYTFSFSVITANDSADFNDSITVAFTPTAPVLRDAFAFSDSIKLNFNLQDTSLNWLVRVNSPVMGFYPVSTEGISFVTGTTPNTPYDIDLIEICGSDTIIGLSTTVFSVCEYVGIPYVESFEATTCYQILGDTIWEHFWFVGRGDNTAGSSGPSFAQDGDFYMTTDPWGGSNDAIFHTAYLDLRNTSDVEFSFYYLLNASWIGGLRVEVDTGNTKNWVEIFNKEGDQGNSWKRFGYDIPNQFLTDSVRFRFIAERANSSVGPSVDNIQVKTKAADDVVNLLLSEGSCYSSNANPFRILAKNNGLNDILGYSASVFAEDSTLIETVADSTSTFASDSIFTIEFTNTYTKTNQVYYSVISINGDSASSDNFAQFDYESETPSINNYTGSVELEIEFDLPGLIDHTWLITTTDSGITNYAFTDTNNIAFFDGLAQETQYPIEINEVCGTDTNLLRSTFVTTTCSYNSIPYFLDFSSRDGCFELIPGDFDWSFNSFNPSFIQATLASFDGPAGDTAFLDLAFLDITSEPNPKLYFDYALSSSDPVNLIVQVDTTENNNWSTIASITQGTNLNWADTSIALNNFISDSVKIRIGAIKVVAGSNSRRDYYKLDNVEVFGTQGIDYNFIGFQFGDSCAYQDSLPTFIIFNNAGVNDLNGISVFIEEGRSASSNLNVSQVSFPQTIVAGDTVLLALGNKKYGRYVKAYFNDSTDIITNNNSIENSVENEFGTFKKNTSNGTVDLGFVISPLSSDSLQLAIAEESHNNQEDLFQFSSMIRDFSSADSSIVFSNLNSGFNYKIQVREFCNGNFSDFLLDFDNINNSRLGFKMDCADTVGFGYFETFDYEAASFSNKGCFKNSTTNHSSWWTDDFVSSFNSGPRTPPSKPNYLVGSPSGTIGDSMVVITPYLDLHTNQTPVISFNYHLYAPNAVNLIFQADSAGEWKTLFFVTGDQGPDWKFQSLFLPQYRNTITRFRFISQIPTAGNKFQVDPAIDNFSVDSATSIEVVLEENIQPFTDLLSLDYLVATTVSSPIVINQNQGPFGMSPSQIGSNVDFTIVSGNEGGHFRIDSTTNVLQSNKTINLDKEAGTAYNLRIAYNKNGNNDTLTIDFTIQDVQEPLYAGRGSSVRIETNDQFRYNGKIVPDGTEHTVAFWMKNKSHPQEPEMINFGAFKLDYSSYAAEFNGGTGGWSYISNQGWVHIAQTFTSTSSTVYLNGEVLYNLNPTNTTYTTNYLGNPTASQNTGEGFRFDDFMLWKQPLSQDEIKALMAGNFNTQDTNLVAYYDMDYAPNSSSLIDRTGNGFDLQGVNQTYARLDQSIDTVLVYLDNSIQANDSISRVVNYDPDSNVISLRSFSDTSGNFTLNSIDNTIRTSSTSDFSSIPYGEYSFSYSVEESGDNSIATVNYLVILTSTPQAPNENLLVNENSPIGDTLTNLSIINADTALTYRYAIVGGNIGNSFGIDSLSADLFIANNDSLDAELYTSFNLLIEARSTDSSFFDTGLVSIALNDLVEPLYAGYGNALQLDGVNDHVSVNHQVIPSTGNFTLSLWAKQNAAQSSEFILVSQNSQFSTSNKRFYFGATGTGAIRVGDDWNSTGATFPSDLGWHHYAIVRSANNIELYIDGAEVAEKGSNYDNPNLTPFRIGRQFGSNTNYFNGLIDEVKVYTEALSEEEILAEVSRFPEDTVTTLRAYFNFDSFEQDSVYDVSANQWNGAFVNFASSAFANSYDSVAIFLPENLPENDTLFALRVLDPDLSETNISWFSGDSATFLFDSATQSVVLIDSSAFNFEVDSVFSFGFSIEELGDNQIDTVYYLLRLTDQPDPFNADVSVIANAPAYNHVPKSQYNGIAVIVSNSGPLTFNAFDVVTEFGVFSETHSLDSLPAGADTVLHFNFPNAANTVGVKSFTTYLLSDTFDISYANDTARTLFAITDSVLARGLLPDTVNGDLWLEYKPLINHKIGPTEAAAITFDITREDTLSSVAFFMRGIASTDTFTVNLWSFSTQPDSLLETQTVSFSDTTWGFKSLSLSCFNLLDSGRYALSITKTKATGSNARLATASTNYDSTATWYLDSSGNWNSIFPNNGFISHPVVAWNFGRYTLPNVISLTSDTAAICLLEDTLTLTSELSGSFIWDTPDTLLTADSINAYLQGMYRVASTTLNNCTFSDSIFIQKLPLTQVNLGSDTAICEQDTLTLTIGSFPEIYWSNGDSNVVSSNFFTAGFHSVQIVDTNGCVNYDTLSLALDTLPLVRFDSLPEICGNEADLVIPTAAYEPMGGVFSSSSLALAEDTLLVAISGEGTSGDIVYSFTDANGCAAADTLSLTIKFFPKPVAPTLGAYCNNEPTFALPVGFPSYGYYRGPGVSQDSLLTADSLTPGSYQLTFIADSANGCSDSAFTSFTIDSVTTIDSISIAPICENEGQVWLNGGFPTGGVFSNSLIVNDTLFPSLLPIGNNPVTYTLTNGFGCVDSLTDSVRILPKPAVSLNPLPAICNNDSIVNLVGLVTDTSLGIFRSPGGTGYTFDPTVADTGLQTITFIKQTSEGCSDSSSQQVNVLPSPNIQLTTAAQFCVYDTINLVSFTGITPSIGYFEGSGILADSVSYFRPADSLREDTVQYTVNFSNGCADSAEVAIQLDTVPNLSLSLLNTRICKDAPNLIVDGANIPGGSFSGPDSAIAFAGNSTFFYPQNTSLKRYPVTYSFTDNNGCLAQAIDTIFVDTIPKAIVQPIPSLCAFGDTIQLGAFGNFGNNGVFSGNAVFYDSSASSYFFNPDSASISPNNLINYTVVDSFGCQGDTFRFVTVNPLPQFNFNPIGPYCVNDATDTLTQTAPNSIVTFKGSGVGLDTASGAFYFDPDTSVALLNTVFMIVENNTTGCIDSTSQQVLVDTIPFTSLSIPSNDTLCFGSLPVAISGGQPAGGSYSLINDPTLIQSGQYFANNANVGTDTLVYTYTNPQGCVNTDTAYIEITPLPSLSFTLANNSLCNKDSAVALTGGTATSGNIAQSFYTGPGVMANSFDPNNLFPGNYNIFFVAIDSLGCADSLSQLMEVKPQPTINFPVVSNVCLQQDSVPVNAATSGASSWSYSLVSNLGNTIHPDSGYFNANVAGTDTIKFVLTDTSQCTDSVLRTITVDTLPTVSFSLPTAVCKNSPSPILLNTGIPSGGTYTYQDSALISSVSPSVFLPGTNEVVYRAADANGCFGSDTQQVFVNVPDSITFDPLPELCSNGDPFTFSEGWPQSGVYSAPLGMVNDSVFDPTSVFADSILITFTYTNSLGCDSSLSQFLYLNKPLPVVYNPPLPTLCIDEDTVNLQNNLSIPTSAYLNFHFEGPGIADSSGAFLAAAANVGGKDIEFFFTDTNTCEGSITSQLIVRPLPEPILEQSESQICLGDSAILSVLNGQVDILWETGDSASSIEVRPDSAKWYAVTLTDFYGCVNSDSILQDVYNNFFVEAEKDSLSTELNTPTSIFPLDNDRGNITSVSVINGPLNGSIDDDLNPELVYTPNAGFRRMDTLYYEMCDDFCPTVCDTGIVKIKVFGDPNDFIPGGFSPDGDGTNDWWFIPGIDLYPNNSVIVFNRWGDKVFEAAPYVNSPTQAWRAQAGGVLSYGEELPDGTYFYIITLQEGQEPITGTVEVKRRTTP